MFTYAFILVVLCAVAMGISLAVNIVGPMVSYSQKTSWQVIALAAVLLVYYIIAAVNFHTFHSVTILVICAALKCLGWEYCGLGIMCKYTDSINKQISQIDRKALEKNIASLRTL